MWIHLVVRSIPPVRPLDSFEPCSWLWCRLRAAFPDALACVLMPNGVHLLVVADDPVECHARLVGVMRGFTRRYGNGRRLWEPVPAPVVPPDRLHQRRTLRYIPLNPSRAGLVSDPLEWLWSTYRDVMGASADPWVTAGELAEALRRPRPGFERDHHAYVSGDPSVLVGGTPPPTRADESSVARFPLQRIELASAAACRVSPADVFRCREPRRLFVALALDQGWPVNVVARACGLTTHGVRKVTVTHQALDAGRLCVNDDRLLAAVSGRSLPPEAACAPSPTWRQGLRSA